MNARGFFKNAVLALLLVSVSIPANAQADTSASAPTGSYKFKDDEQQGPSGADYGLEDGPERDAEGLYVPFSFPHLTEYFGYRPSYFSISQTLESGGFAVAPNFHYTNYVPVSFSFGGLLQTGSRFEVEAAFSVQVLSISNTQFSTFNLDQSSATIFQGTVTPYYCFRRGSWQICPGVGLGVDGFPDMQFGSDGNLALTSSSDMIVHGVVKATNRFSMMSSLGIRLGYDQGILNSSGNGTSASLHRTIWGEISFSTPLSPKYDFEPGIRVEDKTTNFTQTSDVWSVSTMLYALYLGIRL